LASVYLHSTHNVAKNQEYFTRNTEIVDGAGEAFGSRSKKTLRDLLALRIKGYFSACLTLTINQPSTWAAPFWIQTHPIANGNLPGSLFQRCEPPAAS
jgi:hypothetical protein